MVILIDDMLNAEEHSGHGALPRTGLRGQRPFREPKLTPMASELDLLAMEVAAKNLTHCIMWKAGWV